MASTNKTSNLELSQFIATDTPTWLVDYNGDMEKIDAGVGRVEELAQTASTQAVGAANGLQATNQTVTTLSGQVANVQNQANTTTASVTGINNRLGNADISGIGDGTITGAISTQNSILNQKTTYYVGVEEHIATMENGTKVYRKRFSNYAANVTSTLILDASLNAGTITPISMVASVNSGEGVEWRPLPLFFTGNDYIYVDVQNTGLSLYINGNVRVSGYNVEITYTKKNNS